MKGKFCEQEVFFLGHHKQSCIDKTNFSLKGKIAMIDP